MTSNRFASRNTYTDEWSVQLTADERDASHLARSLWRQNALPVNCRPAWLAEIIDAADAASQTFDRMLAAYAAAKAAVVEADEQHDARIDEWIKAGAEGNPPSRAAVAAAEAELTDAGLRLKSAARNASAHGPSAEKAVEDYRPAWREALAQTIDEARTEAEQALSELRVVVEQAATDAQARVDKCYALALDSQNVTGLVGFGPDPAPRLAALVLSVPLPSVPRG